MGHDLERQILGDTGSTAQAMLAARGILASSPGLTDSVSREYLARIERFDQVTGDDLGEEIQTYETNPQVLALFDLHFVQEFHSIRGQKTIHGDRRLQSDSSADLTVEALVRIVRTMWTFSGLADLEQWLNRKGGR